MKIIKRITTALAFLLLFFGFGMIHGGTKLMEKLGSAFINIDAFYFIVLIVLSLSKPKIKPKNE
ncbi:MAG TPA: hypothetical protein PLF35_03155 [Prolixibacteraceae bacterium]|nr:hypothetical protein [Prolixibacteraceae bacterium]